MIRKATVLPVEAKEVEWIRYTGENFSEIEEFINRTKTQYSQKDKFYISTGEDKEIYWKEHGFISVGDFVVLGLEYHLNTKWDGFAIVSWKEFPRMINEEIPVFLDEYKEWLKSEEEFYNR